ncbi:MAG: adenosylcobinamide-phosphate synthase CbiB [Pseudomonadota bacterium]
MTAALLAIVAVLLDWLLGEPRRFHPLVGFGNLAHGIERRLYAPSRLSGALAVALLLVPGVALAAWLSALPGGWGAAFDVWALYFALGHKSLHDHVRPIVAALSAGDEATARTAVSRIVSRDSAALDVAPAACETVLENGNDGVFGAIFWFVLAGAPGAILYRLANTLDAMWGYKNAHYMKFGWAAARLDDLLNWPPARLTAMTYALLGKTRLALKCWREQAPLWDSPNAGPVMAAGAGALGVRLGGPARYEGEWHERPILGAWQKPTSKDIERALALVRHGVALWLALWLAGLSAWGWLHA